MNFYFRYRIYKHINLLSHTFVLRMSLWPNNDNRHSVGYDYDDTSLSTEQPAHEINLQVARPGNIKYKYNSFLLSEWIGATGNGISSSMTQRTSENRIPDRELHTLATKPDAITLMKFNHTEVLSFILNWYEILTVNISQSLFKHESYTCYHLCDHSKTPRVNAHYVISRVKI